MSRITEAEIGIATLRILKETPGGRASLVGVKLEMPNYAELSAEDQTRSVTRRNEEIWEQQVRNLISHRNTAGNIFAEGYATYVEGEPLHITDAGRTYLKNNGY